MTTGTDLTKEIFQDARELQADALVMLAQGRTRNGAEKAWGRRRALLTPWCWAGTGDEPELTGETSDGSLHLDGVSPAVAEAPAGELSLVLFLNVPRTDLISQEPQNARVWFEAHSTGS